MVRWPWQCKHPADRIALGPPDFSDWHVATCLNCYERWAMYGHRVSDDFLDGMEKFGVNEDIMRILRRSNQEYEEQRARYEQRAIDKSCSE